MAARPFRNSVIDPKLFDAFFYITMALYLRVFVHVEDAWGWILSIGAFILMVVTWHLWKRAPYSSPVAALLFTLASTVGFILIGNLVGLALLWLALIVIMFSLSPFVAWGYLVALSCLSFVLHAVTKGDVVRGVWEATALGLLMACGLNFALLLQRAVTLDEERTIAYNKLQRQLEQSQDLVINEERARIADALHDSLGHKLTAVCMSLDYVAKTISSRPDRALEETQVARELTSEAIDDMRKVVRAMNPIAIDNNPLTTIRALAESFSTTSLQASFESDVEQLPEDQALLALRFAQEALTNVVRHSSATEVHMSLTAGPPHTFQICDNGHVAREVSPGFGIRSLSDRAAELGALLTYDSSNGFALTLTFPAEVPT